MGAWVVTFCFCFRRILEALGLVDISFRWRAEELGIKNNIRSVATVSPAFLITTLKMRYQRLFQRESWLDSDAIEEAGEKDGAQTYGRQMFRRTSVISSFWTILGYVIAFLLAVYLLYDKHYTRTDFPHIKSKSSPFMCATFIQLTSHSTKPSHPWPQSAHTSSNAAHHRLARGSSLSLSSATLRCRRCRMDAHLQRSQHRHFICASLFARQGPQVDGKDPTILGLRRRCPPRTRDGLASDTLSEQASSCGVLRPLLSQRKGLGSSPTG